MNIEEIKQAVDDGLSVKYARDTYDVIKDRLNRYLIVCRVNNNAIGLHGQIGSPFHNELNGQESLFYIDNTNQRKPGGRLMTRAQLEQLGMEELLAEAKERRIVNREKLSRDNLIAAIVFYDKF